MYCGFAKAYGPVLGCVVFVLTQFAGCGGGGGGSATNATPAPSTPAAVLVTGSVGDGPVIDANVVIRDANGEIVAQEATGQVATYRIMVPSEAAYPLTITATGGTDLVTNLPLDMELRSVVHERSQLRINLTPLNTLITQAAACLSGGVTLANLQDAEATVRSRLSMGLNPFAMHDAVTIDNAPAVILANEGFAEILRRTAAALATTSSQTSLDVLIERIGCDLSDHVLDGRGPQTDPRTTAAFLAAVADVLSELLAKRLEVGGREATARMDDAIRQIFPDEALTAGVTAVPTGSGLVEQTRRALAVLQTRYDDSILPVLVSLLDVTPTAQIAPAVDLALTSQASTTLAGLADRIAQADDIEVTALLDASRRADLVSRPALSFAATPDAIVAGAESQLSWASTNADRCVGTSAWTGPQTLDGSVPTGPLNQTVTYGLSCSGLGGTATQSVQVRVGSSAPPAPPQVDLVAISTTVMMGDPVTLSWTSSDATVCAASLGWAGDKATNDSEIVGALSVMTTYALTCSGPGGDATDSVTVAVVKPHSPPSLTFAALPGVVVVGDNVVLDWSATDATTCDATGNWNGSKGFSGSEISGPLSSDVSFTLSCTGPGGSVSETRSVTVNPAPPPDPSADLTANPDWVNYNALTTLTWTTANLDRCDASGAWSGPKDENGGSESVGPLTQDDTFTLTCSGPGGSAVSAVSVGVRSALLSWDPPTHNIDGTPLADLAGFNVYYGQGSRNYTNVVPINDPATLKLRIDLTPGTYYFTVTATNSDGHESAYAGELSKTIL